MDTKQCKSCGVTKSITDDFPKNGRIYRAICKPCHSSKQKERYYATHEVQLEKKKQQYALNPRVICENNKKYRLENKEICAQKKEYYQQNRDEILQKTKTKDYKSKRNKYLKERRANDRQFAMVNAYRARLNEVLRKQKKNTYISYVKCKREELLDWIEFQFGSSFSWETYGKMWVIDHVIPIDFFNLDDEHHVNMCFSWFNLRPYETTQNHQKSNKIILEDVESHQKVINNFSKISSWYQAGVEIHQWLRKELRYGKNPSILGNSQPSS